MTQLLQNNMDQGMYTTTTGATYIQRATVEANSYAHLDRPSEILSFKAVFNENIHNSRLESERVRRLVIQYFLEDNSIKISEARQRNSGIHQGKFLLRQKVRNPETGEVFQPVDLQVGGRIYVFGRMIEIVDADDFTRRFFRDTLNMDLADGYDWDKDNFETQVLQQ